ncbi:hypothetical protein [Planotetraspora sp. GP83]|uniref:hypothetical protein n=1 Tax=Planotetraspora sp. GP83 TaxID=3156264 RepID=UPI003511A808
MTENPNPGPADATVRLPHPPAPGEPYGASYPPGPAYASGGQYPPPSYGTPPPPRAAGPVRPRLLWVFLAWALFVVLLIVGVGGFAGGLFSTISDVAPAKTFAGGQAVSARLDPKDKPAIYAAADQPTNVSCEVRGDQDEKVTLTQPKTSQTVAIGDRKWELLFTVGVPSAGTYQVSCDGEGVTFGIGKELTASGGKLGGAIALLALPFLGFLAAVIVTIVVLVRRSANRRRPPTHSP